MAEGRSDDDIPGMLGSETDFDVVCQPCGFAGNTVEAGGYCLDCSEHLCAACYTYHRNMSMSRHHKLVDKENMPNQPTGVKFKDLCTERCQSHEDEIIKYFCPVHKKLGCTLCVTIKHKMCEDVGYIPELSKDLETSEEYNAFQTRLNELILNYENAIKISGENKKMVLDNYTRVLEDVEAYKQEIVDRFNQLHQDIKSKINDIKRSETDRMNTVFDAGNTAVEELKRMSSYLETLRSNNQYCQLFINIKEAEQKLLELGSTLQNVTDICVKVFKFEAGQQLQTLMRNQDVFGKVVTRLPNATTLSHVADVNVRTGNNSNLCGITGAAVLSENKLVIADYHTDSIKLIDTVNKKIISELQPGGYTWDVARVSQDQIVVTQRNTQNIVFIRCGDRLVIDRTIKVNGHCHGIDCVQDKLFVTYRSPAKTGILSLSGEVLQSFHTNSQGQQLFSDPEYVCVNPRNQTIYVSDWGRNSVLQLDMDGNVMAEYKDDELKRPSKMTVDSWNNVYLCCANSHNVHLLTPECRKVKILLEKKVGLNKPRSISWCHATDKLYIGMYGDDHVKLYHIE